MDRIAPFRITVCGIEELLGHCETGASHVLSILDPDHPVPEAFGRFGEHAKLELRFHDVIEAVPGMAPPEAEHVAQLLAFGDTLRAESRSEAHLLVHCHAGISRSTAAMSLILAQALPQLPGAAILDAVHRIREKAWPNLRMMEMGDAQLGRGGDLVRAAADLYQRQLLKRPHIAEFMSAGGREREVALGGGKPKPEVLDGAPGRA